MKTKTIGLLLVISLFFLAEIGFAGPITLPDDTALFFQFTNIELVSGNNDLIVPGINPLTGNSYDYDFGTSGNWGLVKISTLVTGAASLSHTDIQGGGANLFTDITDGQITGIFYDIQLTGTQTATGGYMDLYWSDTSTVDQFVMAGTSGAPDAATVSLFTTGTFLARLYFDTGIVSNGSNTTLQSTTDPTTLGTSGQADSFASVDTSVVGAWTDILNGDWFWTDPDGDGTYDDYRDVRFSTFYNGIVYDQHAATQNNWYTAASNLSANALRSNDPGRVWTGITIPEPGTFFLFGLGLLSIAGTARRRKKLI